MFKQQLFNALKCSEIDENKFKMLKYHKQDLLNIIIVPPIIDRKIWYSFFIVGFLIQTCSNNLMSLQFL